MHDEESGLVYNRARMLHPGLGRFIQRDPAGYVDGMNLNQYELSSPGSNLDPQGLYVSTYLVIILPWICHGTCNCAGFPLPTKPRWMPQWIFAAILAREVAQIIAAQEAATQTCATGTCLANCPPSRQALQPTRQMACVQAVLRAVYGPGVTCNCT